MTDPLRFKLVDAFTQSAYAGNVAGVVFDADALTERQMQLIAAEFNASETAFVLNPTTRDAALRLRWFTPGCEVNFCGHATLAAIHGLIEDGRFAGTFDEPGKILPIETRSGVLTVYVETSADPAGAPTIWLGMPHSEPKKTPVNLPPLLAQMGLTLEAVDPRFTPIRTQDDDVMFAVNSLQVLNEMRPSMGGIVEYGMRAGGVRGIFVTTLNTLSAATVTQSRFFAPAAGVDEDPVTGSAHGPLAWNLVNCGLVPMNDDRAEFWCAQGKAGGRAGLVRVVVEDAAKGKRHIRIGGSCMTTVRGTFDRLPRDVGTGRLFMGC